MLIDGKFTQLKRTRLPTLESLTGVSIFEHESFMDSMVFSFILVDMFTHLYFLCWWSIHSLFTLFDCSDSEVSGENASPLESKD